MKKHLILMLAALVLGCESEIDTLDTSASTSFYSLQNGAASQFAGDGYQGGDRFNDFEENPFVVAADNPVSTFSIDADGGSYGIARRFLNEGREVPAAAIRTEEFINYFPLNYAENTPGHPIALNGEVSKCPWNESTKLVRIGIRGKYKAQLPPSNLVLLIDVSGSMQGADRLELLKKGFSLMVESFKASDRIAIVTYAGTQSVALESTPGDQKLKIRNAITALGAGGSTAGAQGIVTAYEIAEENFIPGGNNRVILGTDGDFNVGISKQEDLVALIEKEREKGIFLTTIGVGIGNLNDGMLEQVADHGNGTYEYLDNERQAKKIFVDEYHKFYPAAKDVKVQVEFNPNLVEAYRLIGYENRLLKSEDFEDDKKDAGEISVGQNVTALYEVKPAASNPAVRVSPTFTIDFRYKNPNENVSIPLRLEIYDEGNSFSQASENMRFTVSVAGFGLLLRNSKYKGSLTFDDVISNAIKARSFDPEGHRSEFIELVKKAKSD
jgi:Ca-activated chloride channel family protein